MMFRRSHALLAPVFLSATGLASLTVNLDDTDSIKQAAKLVAKDLIATYYNGTTIPGLLTPQTSYYWWTGGALWTALLDYRDRTGDTQFNNTTAQGLLWQVGANYDFAPANWTSQAGNDDQSIWALAALAAVETDFDYETASTGGVGFSGIASRVWEEQSAESRRVPTGTAGNCSGALRWATSPVNAGYNYVNSDSNLAYLDVGAQLGLVHGTLNDTEYQQLQDTFTRLQSIGLIDDNYNVFDSARTSDNCSSISRLQWSLAAGLALEGTSAMYNLTAYIYNTSLADATWKPIVTGLLSRTTDLFFNDGVAVEVACESNNKCTTNMSFYKFYLLRGLASTMFYAPFTADTVLPILKSTAAAAVETCGSDGSGCSFVWSGEGNVKDGVGAGGQISTLGALISLLPPVVGAAAEYQFDNFPSDNGSTPTTTSGSGGSSATPSHTSGASSAGVTSFVALCGLGLLALFI
ncbi:glycosyl hydrolase family 76-domain-containing protein [Xylariaceae sp. FL0255]|nr:glycosyl hydrolase family 76-domain-containing protein [Xylariaceae sp. FL0255]